MTDIKFQSKLPATVQEVLQPRTGEFYSKSGGRWMAVVELHHADRNDPAEDAEDVKRYVALRIAHLEMPADEKQGEILREVQKALWLHRTARGTLLEDDDVELSESTLEMAAGMLHALEAARLRVAVTHWAEHARTAAAALSLSPKSGDALRELRKVADGLGRLLAGIEPADETPSAGSDFLRNGSGVFLSGGAR